jgi:hypothetical protein
VFGVLSLISAIFLLIYIEQSIDATSIQNRVLLVLVNNRIKKLACFGF